MNLVEQMVSDRVTQLLAEVEVIAEEMVVELDDKRKSTKVSDFTTVGEIPTATLRRLGVVQLQITLLKGMV